MESDIPKEPYPGNAGENQTSKGKKRLSRQNKRKRQLEHLKNVENAFKKPENEHWNGVLHVPNDGCHLPPERFTSVKVSIKSVYEELGSIFEEGNGNFPFINYMHTKDVTDSGNNLIAQLSDNWLMDFNTCINLEYIYCFFTNKESKKLAICKSSDLKCLGLMLFSEACKTPAYIKYIFNRDAFVNMLEKFKKMLQERYQQYLREAGKLAYVYPLSVLTARANKIGNLHAECRFFVLQIKIGLALISDLTDTKWRNLCTVALEADPLVFEHEMADEWFKKAIRNTKTQLWEIKDRKCVGIDIPAKHFTVKHCLEEDSGEDDDENLEDEAFDEINDDKEEEEKSSVS